MNTFVSVGKVCDILNDILERYWQQPMLSQKLDQASVAQYLKIMGIEIPDDMTGNILLDK